MVFAILVAFKVNEDKSILYRKCKSFRQLIEALNNAVMKEADFISIRFPKNEKIRSVKLDDVCRYRGKRSSLQR